MVGGDYHHFPFESLHLHIHHFSSSHTPSSPHRHVLIFYVSTFEVLGSFTLPVSSSPVGLVLLPHLSLRARVLVIRVVVVVVMVRWGRHFCGVVCSCVHLLHVHARCSDLLLSRRAFTICVLLNSWLTRSRHSVIKPYFIKGNLALESNTQARNNKRVSNTEPKARAHDHHKRPKHFERRHGEDAHVAMRDEGV